MSVAVDDIKGLDGRPETDLDRLITYIGVQLPKRERDLTESLHGVASLKLKGDIVALGFKAIDFRRELSGWVALARRVRDERLADAYDLSHTDRTLQANAEDLKRPSSKLVETRAKSEVAPLSEALERLEAARDECATVISWCQSLQRFVRDEEFGSLLESQGAPEELFSAPIGSALKNLR